MKKIIRYLSLPIGAGALWLLAVPYACTFPKPKIPAPQAPATARWIDKKEFGINQLILQGAPYPRGVLAGEKTKELLERQEVELVAQLQNFIPGRLLQESLVLFARQWFWGIDRYFEDWMSLEMLGVSLSASPKFNYLADPFLRQVGYHGLHEVGQLMVDQGSDDVGCTVVNLPVGKQWIIGRNFDFEGGRIFDSEKILKWVFPDQGYAYVSVIWAGMVGAVTGVNEHGLYLSINAAGSTDFSRIGTPSTLVLLKALQFAKTADEALTILRDAQMFITDIFIVSDRHTGKLYRVEKSPRHTEVIPLTGASVVTNHLWHPRWKDDRINVFRRQELTSEKRETRGLELVQTLAKRQPGTSVVAAQGVLDILRDKKDENGNELNLGNRQAIDALIAAHAIVFDQVENTLYVSQGPALSGAFRGYDLTRSFSERNPVLRRTLPPDPRVSPEKFSQIKLAYKNISQASRAVAKKKCPEARQYLNAAETLFSENPDFYMTQAEILEHCEGDPAKAKAAREYALRLRPAYPRQVRALESKLSPEKAAAR